MYLNVREAEYQVIDVSEVQPQEYLDLAKQYGYSVPLVTDGKTAYTGWNLAKLNEMLRGWKKLAIGLE